MGSVSDANLAKRVGVLVDGWAVRLAFDASAISHTFERSFDGDFYTLKVRRSGFGGSAVGRYVLGNDEIVDSLYGEEQAVLDFVVDSLQKFEKGDYGKPKPGPVPTMPTQPASRPAPPAANSDRSLVEARNVYKPQRITTPGVPLLDALYEAWGAKETR